MATIRSRGENVGQTETIQLMAEFYGPDGILTNLDSTPTITIEEPSGNVLVGPTNTGVYSVSTGIYGYNFDIGYNYSFGVWVDHWEGVLNGLTVSGSFNFVVQNTQLPAINSDGYEHLGDDPGTNYSQTAIHNINLLMKSLRARLNTQGKVRSTDANGNVIFVDCDIYSVDHLVAFLANSLSLFNNIPYFTFFTFDDTEFLAQFHDVIVQGAVYMALASKMILERGREFQMADNSLQFNPPSVAEIISSQYSKELDIHMDKVKYIKDSMRGQPIGLGSISIATARHPALSRLRHLRARRWY